MITIVANLVGRKLKVGFQTMMMIWVGTSMSTPDSMSLEGHTSCILDLIEKATVQLRVLISDANKI